MHRASSFLTLLDGSLHLDGKHLWLQLVRFDVLVALMRAMLTVHQYVPLTQACSSGMPACDRILTYSGQAYSSAVIILSMASVYHPEYAMQNW